MKTIFFCAIAVVFASACAPSTRSNALRVDRAVEEAGVLIDAVDLGLIERVGSITDHSILEEARLPREEFATLAALLTDARYDTGRNDSGIMLKVVEPDCTFVITYESAAGRDREYLPVWKDGGWVKFRDLWYRIPAGNAAGLVELARRYS